MTMKSYTIIQPFSQKYRQKPKQIVNKLNSDISQIQAQVKIYNMRQQKLSHLIPNSFCKKQCFLKMLTQPKLQKILFQKDFNQDNIFLKFNDGQKDKKSLSKLTKKNTLKSNFVFQQIQKKNKSDKFRQKRITIDNSNQKFRKQNNFTFFQQEPQRKLASQVKITSNYLKKSKFNQKNISAESFYISSFNQNAELMTSTLLKNKNRASTFNDSIAMPFAQQIDLNEEESRQLSCSKNLQYKIATKQKQLQKQWGKAEKFRVKFGLQNFQANVKKQDKRFRKNSKLNQIIDKILIRRPQTTMTKRSNNIDQIKKVWQIQT